MSDIIWYELAGFVGVALYLGSYAALQAGLVKGNSYTYAVLNMLGAGFVLVSLFHGWNTWSAVIQISWISISLFGMTRVWVLTRGLRFTEEEDELRHRHFTHMRRLDAKMFLRSGAFRDCQPGEDLTHQDQPVTQLSYIASGGVDILIGGKVIAQVGPGEFIGEMGCLAQAPASATVRTNQPSRCFLVSSDALNRQIRRNPDIGAHLEAAFSHNVREKLKATNARLQEALHANDTLGAGAQ